MTDLFQEFWSAYPRKVAKKAAEKAYWKARKDTSHEDIMAGLERYCALITAKGTATEFVVHASTWLNQGRWEDEETATRVADSHTARERPLYLRQDNGPDELSEDDRRRRKARAEAMEEMRREGLDWRVCDPSELRRRVTARLTQEQESNHA